MFVRKKKNKSGTTSIHIIDKSSGKFKVVKVIGTSSDEKEIEHFWRQAHFSLPRLVDQHSLDFTSQTDQTILDFLKSNSSVKLQVVGPELILGKLFDLIGFNQITEELFRHLVITRLSHPGSKLKTVDYLERYHQTQIDVDAIYRFLDKLNSDYKNLAGEIAFNYTKSVLKGKVNVVFYDMTTLYFEASDEDDFRKPGFSKDGKAQNPQIMIGLLVGPQGFPIGYEIFDGKAIEGHTLIPVLKYFEKKFNLSKPVVVADAGLLHADNIVYLKENSYQFILGGRPKSEKKEIKKKILSEDLSNEKPREIKKEDGTRLIFSYSQRRAVRDEKNRNRGIKRLEGKIRSGKLTKEHINNRGYNKYLKLTGEIKIEIDYEKFILDKKWDGIKAYITNTKLTRNKVIKQYNQLWQIEKAFRINKTDLKVRPIFHRLRRRIEAHILIAFCAYTIYKELERILILKKKPFSAQRAVELTRTMYALSFTLPESGEQHSSFITFSQEQKILEGIIKEYASRHLIEKS